MLVKAAFKLVPPFGLAGDEAPVGPHGTGVTRFALGIEFVEEIDYLEKLQGSCVESVSPTDLERTLGFVDDDHIESATSGKVG